MKINLLNLFICHELFFIEQQQRNLKKFCEENNYQFLKQTVEKDNHEKILNFLKQELYTNSFFFIKKFIFIKNISILFKNKNIDLVFFTNYWVKPRDDIIIYLVETKENDFPLNIIQKLKNFFYIEKKKILQGKNLFHYIKNIFNKEYFNIKNEIIFFLIKKTKNNLFLLHEMINKIKTYHLPDKKIYDEKILEKLFYNESENIFLLIKFLINNQNAVETLLLFKHLIELKNEPIIIVHQTIQKLKDIIISKYLINKNSSQEQIASILNYSLTKTYFLMKEIENLNLQSIQNLLIIFIDLYYKIQKKIIDAKIGLEMFLFNQIFYKKNYISH